MADLELPDGRVAAAPIPWPRTASAAPAEPAVPRPAPPPVSPPPAQPQAPAETFDPTLSREHLEQAVDDLNRTMQGVNARLSFKLYGERKSLYVEVVDRHTREVLRVMPPLELLALRDKIVDAVGVVLDEFA